MRVRMTMVGRGWCRDQQLDKDFPSLEAFKNWIFNTDGVYEKWYSDGRNMTFFPLRDDLFCASIHTDNQYVSCIEIHQIETSDGILLSDGTYTDHQKHCSPVIRQFYAECDEKLKSPRFNFA